MNIIETRIPDVTDENINLSKTILADNIIKNVYPLFDGVYTEKLDVVKKLKIQIKSKKRELRTEKETMELLMNEYKRKKKISKLLDRLESLIESGLMYDGTMKHETVILLKIIDKLSPEKLDEQLSKSVKMLNKRFAKI
jgi:predicted Holliday junction resolvase-like endonuclease